MKGSVLLEALQANPAFRDLERATLEPLLHHFEPQELPASI